MAGMLPDGTVTVVFTDVEGSTALRSELGDRRAGAVLDAHADTIRSLAATHRGTEVKALGDGFLLVFTSTRQAVEFGVAVHAAFARQRLGPANRPMRVRIGMHTGEVVARDGDLFGQAVHAAARIQGIARGGETLASTIVRTLAGSVDGIAWEDHGTHELRGFDEPWPLYAAVALDRPAADHGAPLVGRAREQAILVARLDDLAAGAGGVITIEGEPGVGKSRLAQELVTEGIARGHRVLTARCSERRVNVPYGPWVDLLRAGMEDTDPQTLRTALGDAAGEVSRVLPELRQQYPDVPEPLQLPADQEQRLVLQSVSDFLCRAAADRPLVLLVDDVQWADDASLGLLDEGARIVSMARVLVVAIHRPVAADTELGRVTARLVGERIGTRIRLDPLDAQAVEQLLTATVGVPPPSGVVAQMVQRTGGNPFFVEELFAHLVESGGLLDPHGAWLPAPDLGAAGVPDSVRLVLKARLARLGSHVRPVLDAAAILGRSSEFRHVGQLAGVVSPAELVDNLDAAEQAGIVTTEPDPTGRTLVTFVHDLVRDAVLDDMTHVRRQQLHVDAATVLGGAGGGPVAEVAAHLLAAGDLADPVATCRALCAAGDHALSAAAFSDAARAFAQVVELGVGGAQIQADAHRGLGYALRRARGWEAAMPHLLAALRTYEDLGDADAIGDLSVDIMQELAWAMRLAEAADVIEEGLAALDRLGDEHSTQRLQLTGARAGLLAMLGARDAALDMAASVEERLGNVADDHATGSLWTNLGLLNVNLGRMNVAEIQIAQGLERLRRTGDRWQLGEALGWWGLVGVSRGRLDDVRAGLDELDSLTHQLGHVNGRVLALGVGHQVAMIRNELDLADALALENLHLCEDQGLPWLAVPLGMLAETALSRGDEAAAASWAMRALASEVEGAWGGMGIGASLSVASHRGAAEVLALLDAHVPVTTPDVDARTIGRLAAWGAAVLALADVGERDRAATYLPVMRAARDEDGVVFTPWDLVPVDLIVAVAAACDGDDDEAERRMAAARDWVETADAPLVRDRIERWSRWLADAGRVTA